MDLKITPWKKLLSSFTSLVLVFNSMLLSAFVYTQEAKAAVEENSSFAVTASSSGIVAYSETGSTANSGHLVTWTDCVDRAYYSLSTSEAFPVGSTGGIIPTGTFTGFTAFSGSLTAGGLSWSDLQVHFTGSNLGADTEFTDWEYFSGSGTELRYYTGGEYYFTLAGEPLLTGVMPDLDMMIDYSNTGVCTDDVISAKSKFSFPTDDSAASSTGVQTAAQAFLDDLGSGSGISFNFYSLQPAGQTEYTSTGLVAAFFNLGASEIIADFVPEITPEILSATGASVIDSSSTGYSVDLTFSGNTIQSFDEYSVTIETGGVILAESTGALLTGDSMQNVLVPLGTSVQNYTGSQLEVFSEVFRPNLGTSTSISYLIDFSSTPVSDSVPEILTATGIGPIDYTQTGIEIFYTLSGATVSTGDLIEVFVENPEHTNSYTQSGTLNAGTETGSIYVDFQSIFASYTGATLGFTAKAKNSLTGSATEIAFVLPFTPYSSAPTVVPLILGATGANLINYNQANYQVEVSLSGATVSTGDTLDGEIYGPSTYYSTGSISLSAGQTGAIISLPVSPIFDTYPDSQVEVSVKVKNLSGTGSDFFFPVSFSGPEPFDLEPLTLSPLTYTGTTYDFSAVFSGALVGTGAYYEVQMGGNGAPLYQQTGAVASGATALTGTLALGTTFYDYQSATGTLDFKLRIFRADHFAIAEQNSTVSFSPNPGVANEATWALNPGEIYEVRTCTNFDCTTSDPLVSTGEFLNANLLNFSFELPYSSESAAQTFQSSVTIGNTLKFISGSGEFLYEVSDTFLRDDFDGFFVEIFFNGNFHMDEPNTGFEMLDVNFSNAGQYGATGAVSFVLDLDYDLSSDAKGIFFEFESLQDGTKGFSIGNPTISLTGALAGASCSGAVLVKQEHYDGKHIFCEFDSPLTLSKGDKILAKISDGITNPNEVGKYFVGLGLELDSYKEFFGQEVKIIDSSDSTAPLIESIVAKNDYELLVKFNEAISIQYDSNFMPKLKPVINGLNTYNVYTDYENPSKLFISTDEQTANQNYSLTLSGVVADFNGNQALNLTGSFVGFDSSAAGIDYVVPYSLPKEESNFRVDVYGKNDAFSTTPSSVTLGTGVTLSSTVTKVDSNHIYFNVDISSGAVLGPRDLTVGAYTLFDGIYVDQNYANFVNVVGQFTKSYDKVGGTGILALDFDAKINSVVSAANLNLEIAYGSGALPTVTSVNTFNSGATLEIEFANITEGNNYELSFSGVTTESGKEFYPFMKTWFSFFDASGGNFDSQVLAPIVVDSQPFDGAMDLPSSGLVVTAWFDRALQESSVTSENIYLQSSDGSKVSGTLTYTGSEGNFYKLTFTPSSNLSLATDYKFRLKDELLSTQGLGLVGNVPASEGGGHVIHFNTMPDYTNTATASGYYSFDIKKTEPFFGEVNYPKDAILQVVTNETIDTSTVDISNFSLKAIDSAGVPTGSNLLSSVSFSFNDTYSPTILNIDPPSDLTPGTRYQLSIDGGSDGFKGLNGQSFPSEEFIVEFKVGTDSVSAIPFDLTWDFAENDLSFFEVGFSENLDPATVSLSNVSLFSENGNKINLEVAHNVEANSLMLTPLSKLTENVNYTLILKDGLKSISGKSVSGATLPFGGFTLDGTQVKKTYSYTTPTNYSSEVFLEGFYAESSRIELNFNKDIKNATDKSKYSISYCTGFDYTSEVPENCSPYVSLSIPTISYDSAYRQVEISGLDIPSSSNGETIVEIKLNGVESKVGDTLGTCTSGDPEHVANKGCIGKDLYHTPAFSNEISDEYTGDGQAMGLQANVNPQNNTAGKSALYFIDFPIGKVLSAGDKIEVLFPKNFDLTNASLDLESPVNYVNSDTSGNLKFTLSSSTSKNAIVYTIGSNYTLSNNDFIISDVLGIVNPSQAKDYGTDGYIAEISTMNASGLLYDKFKSNPIYIKSAPTGASAKTISVQLKSEAGADLALSGALLHLHTPSGYEQLVTNSSGATIYTGALNEYYGLSLDPFVQVFSGGNLVESSYISSSPYFDIFLDGDKSFAVKLKDESSSTSLAEITGTVAGLSGEKVTLWFSGQKGYFEKELNNGAALSSNNYSFSIKVPKNSGFSTIGIMPTFKKDYLAGSASYEQATWQAQKAQEIQIGTAASYGPVAFSVSKPSIDFTITVQDDSGNKIPNANVFVYSPSGDFMGLYGETDAAGQKTFKVNPGFYTYGASVSGLPPIPDKTIEVVSSNVAGTLVVKLPQTTIKGEVLSYNSSLGSTTPLSDVNIYAFEEASGKFANGVTDSNGKYTLYVGDGTWKLGGWVDTFGPLEEKTLTVAGSSLTGKNFTIETSSLYTLTGQVAFASGTGIAGANVYANPTDGNYDNGGFAFTDQDGNYSIKLKAGDYELFAYSPEHGELGFTSITVAGDSGGNDFTVAAPTTVSFTFTGVGVPNDLTNFDWMLDLSDSSGKGFKEKISGVSSYTFNEVPSGTYKVKVIIPGIGNVYSSGSFATAGNPSILIPLEAANKALKISGTVSDGSVVSDAYIEFKNSSNQIFGVKTSSAGTFSLNLKPDTYTYTVKKQSYKALDPVTVTFTSDTNLGTISISQITNTTVISGSVTSASGVDLTNSAFVNLQGINSDGTTNNNWQGQTVDENGDFSFTVEKGFRWKVIAVADGHEEGAYTAGLVESATSGISISLNKKANYTAKKPQLNPVTPSKGGVIENPESRVKISLPASALGNGKNPGSVLTKETTNVPQTPGKVVIGGKAKKVQATDSNGNAITTLNGDVTISLDYTAADFYSTFTGITIEEIKNIQVSYFDNALGDWLPLPTAVSGTGFGADFETLTGSLTLVNLSLQTSTSAIVTYSAITDHFTDFAPVSGDSSTSSSEQSTSSSSTTSTSTSTSSSTSSSSSSSSSGGGGGGSYVASVGTKILSDSAKKDFETIDNLDLKKIENGILPVSIEMKHTSGDYGATIPASTKITTKDGKIFNGTILAPKRISNRSVVKLNGTTPLRVLEIGAEGESLLFSKPVTIKFSAKGLSSSVDLENVYIYSYNEETKAYDLENLNRTVDTENQIIYTDVTHMTTFVLAEGKTETAEATLVSSADSTSSFPYLDLSGHWAKDFVSKLYKKGVLANKIEYRPDEQINRVEFVKIVMEAFDHGTSSASYTFADTDSTQWYTPYLSKAVELGIVDEPRSKVYEIHAANYNGLSEENKNLQRILDLLGYSVEITGELDAQTQEAIKAYQSEKGFRTISGTPGEWTLKYLNLEPEVIKAAQNGTVTLVSKFRPSDSINRAEAMKVALTAAGITNLTDSDFVFSDVLPNHWFAKYVNFAADKGIVSGYGDGRFAPSDKLTRGQTAKIVSKILELKEDGLVLNK